MSALSRAYIVLRLERHAQADEITAGQCFWSSEEAHAECDRLQKEPNTTRGSAWRKPSSSRGARSVNRQHAADV